MKQFYTQTEGGETFPMDNFWFGTETSRRPKSPEEQGFSLDQIGDHFWICYPKKGQNHRQSKKFKKVSEALARMAEVMKEQGL